MNKEGIIGMKRDLILGGEHTMQCADDVLLSCILETCMVLLTSRTVILDLKHTSKSQPRGVL